MLWSRRQVIAGLVAAGALGGCGFAPAYGPEGAASRLIDSVALPDPDNDNAYLFNQRFEDRLGRGRGDPPAFRLVLNLQTTNQDTGTTSAGNTNRQRLIARAVYSLQDGSTGAALREGRTNAFTGYSTTGSTVATEAAERDAWERLMTMLADQVIDDLILHADSLTAPPDA